MAQLYKINQSPSQTAKISKISKTNKANNLEKSPSPSHLPYLIVQIPAYNEQETLREVIKFVPRHIPGISKVDILVIDDGSADNTGKVAKEAGADFIIRNTQNLGLAQTFQRGINKALELGADIIVNTDADNQYNQEEIPKLIAPILAGKADIVSGNRQVSQLSHMPISKKYGNIVGTKVVSISAGYPIADASSGFRAYSKEAAQRLFVTSKHTYTHDTLIQAKHKNLKVLEVPVQFNARPNGHSKLINSVYGHVKKSTATIIRNTLMYNSLKTLGILGSILIILGLIPMIRWIVLEYFADIGGQHIQSLIAGSILILAGIILVVLGFISDLLAINRLHLEEILYKINKLEDQGR